MNTKRVKRLNKTIDFYKRNFGFFSPYNILIDGTFCTAALESKINISEQLPKYLDSDVNIVTTRCIIMEVEKLSKIIKDLYGTWLIIKQFKIHQCGHTDDFKYILATMDENLREYARKKVFAAPIIFLHRQTPTIEKPPQETVKIFGEKK
ncbi:rRNA-processing protein UTP23-like protein [Armadillidium nasatum]|uniref:rRNA-processing protein UTP23-like protein n=1 Tax=Armadillidium nasatum TaxID=96803 RepID=A0A5N5TM70_9CRUS|nr:rRNA-processing protein UTP23-like protein [Armadillidium nasatum]